MIFKQATTKNDFRSSVYVRTIVFINELGYSPNDLYDDADNISTIFLALDGITPIGSGRITIHDDVALISQFCVIKEKRHKKYGTFLYQTMENFIVDSGISKILLNPGEDSLLFFEKLGFKFDFNNKDLGMMMEKKLK